MQKYLAEFIGTFFLVLTVGCTGISVGPGVIPQTAIGAVLMAMIYAGGPVATACADVPDRELDPIKSGPIEDRAVAAVSRREPRFGVSKGQEKGNVL